MRFVAFEGGGEALSALGDNHVQVLAGDAAEVGRQLEQGVAVRVLAVLSEKRLGGRWAHVPTAREQGFDIVWPILRGLYMAPGVSDREFKEWTDGCQGHRSTGHGASAHQGRNEPCMDHRRALDQLVDQQVESYRKLAAELGLAPRTGLFAAVGALRPTCRPSPMDRVITSFMISLVPP